MAEWGATPDGGCPELEDQSSLSIVWGSTPNRDERLQAREAAWVRNVPGEAWSTGAEVAGVPWQTRRPPPRVGPRSRPRGDHGCLDREAST